MKIALTPLAALIIFTSTLALAADETKRGPLAVCKADAEKLCPGVEPGEGRMAACLTKNESQVSAACKDAMAKARARERAPAPAPSPKT